MQSLQKPQLTPEWIDPRVVALHNQFRRRVAGGENGNTILSHMAISIMRDYSDLAKVIINTEEKIIMLVLSRQANQGITITDADGNVIAHVSVVQVAKHGTVRLGITADRSKVIVDRDEVHAIKTGSGSQKSEPT